MIQWADQEEVDRFAEFDFRLLHKEDFLEFSKAYNESISSQANFFDLGYFNQMRPFAETQIMFISLIKDKTLDMFGIFDNKKLMGVGIFYFVAYSEFGTQITIWIRQSMIGKGLGTYFMRRLTSHALYCKKLHFSELMIDAENIPSRRMAEKVGYELIEINDTYTQGKLGSGKYCRYICFSEELNSLALNYHKQPMDLIDHPAILPEFRHLIHDEDLNEMLRWPYPVLIHREHHGEPFGLTLEKLQAEAEFEHRLVYKQKPSQLIRPNRLKLTQNLLAWR